MTETVPPGFRRQVSEDVCPEPKDEGRAGCDNIPGTRRSDQKRQMTETLRQGFRRRVSAYPQPKGGGRHSGWNGLPTGNVWYISINFTYVFLDASKH